MGLVSQPKRDRLGHPTSSPSIYSCSLWCGSGVPTKYPSPFLFPLSTWPPSPCPVINTLPLYQKSTRKHKTTFLLLPPALFPSLSQSSPSWHITSRPQHPSSLFQLPYQHPPICPFLRLNTAINLFIPSRPSLSPPTAAQKSLTTQNPPTEQSLPSQEQLQRPCAQQQGQPHSYRNRPI